jgi:16S rRNA (cytidine1402-2'-O)-methyltransferase
MTRRAIDVLGAVSVIACEDTRVTGKLLASGHSQADAAL